MKEAKLRPRTIHSVLSTAGIWLGALLAAGAAQAQPASQFYTVPPCRVADTRDPNGAFGGPALGAGQSRTFGFSQCGVSPTARAVALNVTVTGGTAGGHLTLYPGGPVPQTSTINYRAGQTRANNAIVSLGPGALIGVYSGQATGTVHFIIDLNGYFDSPSNNQPPSVNAGPDQNITLPAMASLSGSASDDGLPAPPSLTRTWSETTGLGSVSFGNANSLSTTASFSGPGTYVLRLTVSDGAITRFDELTVTVNPPAGANVGRFLAQATWGATGPLIQYVQQVGFAGFLQEQFNAPLTGYPGLALWPSTAPPTCAADPACVRDNYSMYQLQRRFFTNALYGQDQLRQRVAWALHQMLVVSGRDITLPSWMSPYLQIFDRNAFGNYRQILYEVTLNPAMGRYLDMVTSTRTNPNENYAREILQLFSVGTDLLNLDGTPQLDGTGEPLPSYDQAIVDGFTKIFTGWRLQPDVAAGIPDYITPMRLIANNHDITDKLLLNGVIIPACATAPANCTLAQGDQDLNAAIDNIFYHPNVGPFVSKHLIKYLVTSNPTPAYVARVASIFNNDGTGVRGNMRAVVEAMIMDSEARNDLLALTSPNYGHLKEPALYITNLLRAFYPLGANGSAVSDGYLNPNCSTLDQDVLRPPTVFSYYPADFGAPGVPGIIGPEFGILSAATALRRANFVNTMLGNMTTLVPPGNGRITVVAAGTGLNPAAPNGTAIDISSLVPLAATPTTLVDGLNQLMMFGAMSAQMHSRIVTAVNAVPATNGLLRVRQAIYLIATSSQYQVQR